MKIEEMPFEAIPAKLERYFVENSIKAIEKEIKMILAVQLSLIKKGNKINLTNFASASKKAKEELQKLLEEVKRVHKQEEEKQLIAEARAALHNPENLIENA